MLRLATDMLGQHAAPKCRAEWAALGKRLGIKAIHITERDSQASAAARGRREFVNTWSVEGLVDEACQPAELGWGTHEQKLPPDGCHLDDRRSIFLTRPGGTTLMQSWTPRGGSYRGLLLSHMEALTIADHFTVWDGTAVAWRPTVHFVYRPCDDALASIKELADSGWTSPYKARVLMADIVQGADELGVLLMGRAEWSFWFGSHLTASAARNLAPSNNATTLQVAAGILGGLIWVLENPRVGLREPDEIDHKRILQVARPYLGEFHGFYSNWSPVHEQTLVSPAVVDFACPWQFSNFRVSPTPDQ
jgi:homospermidine synthase